MIPGFKILNEGSTGTGKTYAIATLVKSGITPFVIFTEPGAPALIKSIREHKLSEDSVKHVTISQANQSWTALQQMSKNLNTLSFEAITKLSDPNKSGYTQLIEFLGLCNNFVDHNGESYGDVATWGTDRCLIVDTLTGLCNMGMNLIVGGRPTRSMSDWMVAQNHVLSIVDKLTTGINCHFASTHTSRRSLTSYGRHHADGIRARQEDGAEASAQLRRGYPLPAKRR